MKRLFDFAVALLLLLLLFPLFLVVAVCIKIDSDGPVFYKQSRVGKGMHSFKLYKFRTMHLVQVSNSSLTIGAHDPRITAVGYWLRKYKIDELPQLLNVLFGDMSLVGPRPELMKYVRYYNQDQQRVLTVKPGITDWASIQFCNESDLLEQAEEPENYYIREIIPAKLSRSLQYIDHHDVWIDLKIIFLTVLRIIKN
jgi:lipopolysaccharide/colanic/teichoic acid biosynthesis glycosyltransferase